MSCDFSNPDSIDLGSLAIGASGKSHLSINKWMPNSESIAPGNSYPYQSDGYYAPNERPAPLVQDIKPTYPSTQLENNGSRHFGSPESQASSNAGQMFSGQAGGFPPGMPGMSGGSFSTMKMLGALSEKTIEQFFAPLKQQQASNPEMRFPSFDVLGQQSPPGNNLVRSNSNHCGYPDSQAMPPALPQQTLNSNYIPTSPNQTSGLSYPKTTKEDFYPRYPGENQLSPGLQPWPKSAASYNGQDTLQGMPAVKMEWNEINSTAINARMAGQQLYPGKLKICYEMIC